MFDWQNVIISFGINSKHFFLVYYFWPYLDNFAILYYKVVNVMNVNILF